MKAPLSYLTTYGAAGDPVTRLGWGLIAVSLLVCLIIAIMLIYAIARRRDPTDPGRSGRDIARGAGGLRIVYIGVSISTVVLFACALWTLWTLSAVAKPSQPPALDIEVTGYQWWWEVRYRDAKPDREFVTANEIHIPVGRPVRVSLHGLDVIHSFWVPQLSGKTDVIPGQTNETWLEADRPGTYRGQCGEYCGMQHAHMSLVVVADAPDAFENWRERQVAAASAAGNDALRHGQRVFAERCAVCHTIRGIGAGGRTGPDLTHLMSRSTIAAGTLANTPANLQAWIADAQAIKPGCRMPTLVLQGDELVAVASYLRTLE